MPCSTSKRHTGLFWSISSPDDLLDIPTQLERALALRSTIVLSALSFSCDLFKALQSYSIGGLLRTKDKQCSAAYNLQFEVSLFNKL
jgi:hypothetical protein